MPTIPAETTYSDTELNWIGNEPANVFPGDQSSFWGQARKVFADYLQENVFDRLDQWYRDLNPATCSVEELHNWEILLGIPVDETKATTLRRAFIQSRLQRGPFTRARRDALIEFFIVATFGPAIEFSPSGVPFTADGIPFYSGEYDLTGTYRVVEDIPNFSYDVRILNTITPDAGLERELARITPAGIAFTITPVADPDA